MPPVGRQDSLGTF